MKNYTDAKQSRKIAYIASTVSREKIEAVGKDIPFIPGIGPTMYLNIYNGCTASRSLTSRQKKANALLRLKRLHGVDKVIAFGDIHNDTEMMRISD